MKLNPIIDVNEEHEDFMQIDPTNVNEKDEYFMELDPYYKDDIKWVLGNILNLFL